MLAVLQTVPSNLTRYGLSQIINHLLSLDPARPFDFLISGDLLRTSLHSHIHDRGFSTETVIDVEYVPAVLPPKPTEKYSNDDWIGSICWMPSKASINKANGKKENSSEPSSAVLTGCYDGLIRIWENGSNLHTQKAHEGPIKSLLSLTGTNKILSFGDDCMGKIWKVRHESSGSRSNKEYRTSLDLVRILSGHTDTIEAAASRPDGKRCASAGWDKVINLWDSHVEENESLEDGTERSKSSRKRRKETAGDDMDTGNGLDSQRDEPLKSLEGHRQCVSCLVWPSDEILVSSSWDHTIRVWDVDVGFATETLNHNKAVYAVATYVGHVAPVIFAFGGPESAIKLWDRREKSYRQNDEGQNTLDDSAMSIKSLKSHSSWISALSWHPKSSYHLLSVSHDGCAKVWDIRASIPLATLPGGSDKLLACAWDESGHHMAMGGADHILHTASIEI